MNQWMDCSCCLCGGRVVKLASRSFCVCVCVCVDESIRLNTFFSFVRARWTVQRKRKLHTHQKKAENSKNNEKKKGKCCFVAVVPWFCEDALTQIGIRVMLRRF